MAQPGPPITAHQPSKKRKQPPSNQNLYSSSPAKKQKTANPQLQRRRDARVLTTQTTSAAFSNGALDVDKFVKAREFEIRALERGMAASKKTNNRRAFQQVPFELRRRTASHNVKRVPKRLRERGKKEMVEDNTPTVTARRRKPTRHMRLRMETVKQLRAMGAKKKAAKEKNQKSGEQPTSTGAKDTAIDIAGDANKPAPPQGVRTRAPKIKKATLAKPPVPKAKFRKRQIYKSWLPTHLFHAKRAQMTPPSAPMWHFAIPLTPTQKSYRPTHRASHQRGAVAWDMSYMATIELEGHEDSMNGILRALGVDCDGKWKDKEKWKNGTRSLQTYVYEREAPHGLIAPVAIMWCASSNSAGPLNGQELGKRKRKLFIRVHPSAFFQLWEEVLRLAKVAKPSVDVEDLRFEIGSIEIEGPGSTEALLGALWPSPVDNTTSAEQVESSVETTWRRLAGVTNPKSLPKGALLGFSAQDPRLHYPPRPIELPKTPEEQMNLLETIAKWNVDADQKSPDLFDRKMRLAGSKLPSQKAVNRRKGLAKPGEYPAHISNDPKIPVVLYVSCAEQTDLKPHNGKRDHREASWTILAPWKAIPPIWYSIMHYPLSTGTQPRFGGLSEQRQLAFETGRPWFPADFPGTKAGWDWEVHERRRRWEEWKKRPKGKRTAWEKLDLGHGKKGEIGNGWACDWDFLLGLKPIGEPKANQTNGDSNANEQAGKKGDALPDTAPEPAQMPDKLGHVTPQQAFHLLKDPPSNTAPDIEGKLVGVRLTLLTRGVPQTCARIYRLPSSDSNASLRKAWRALHPENQPNRAPGPKNSLPKLAKNAPAHLIQRQLAQSLLQTPQAGKDAYPTCPAEEDLVGFVTSGNFNLAEGQGTGVGCVVLSKVLKDAKKHGAEDGRLCVIRNAGEGVGRLASWEMVA